MPKDIIRTSTASRTILRRQAIGEGTTLISGLLLIDQLKIDVWFLTAGLQRASGLKQTLSSTNSHVRKERTRLVLSFLPFGALFPSNRPPILSCTLHKRTN